MNALVKKFYIEFQVKNWLHLECNDNWLTLQFCFMTTIRFVKKKI